MVSGQPVGGRRDRQGAVGLVDHAENGRDLGLDVRRRAEDVPVIQGHLADPGQAADHAGTLEAKHCPQFGQAKGQVSARMAAAAGSHSGSPAWAVSRRSCYAGTPGEPGVVVIAQRSNMPATVSPGPQAGHGDCSVRAG
jgi:hypothetical protein